MSDQFVTRAVKRIDRSPMNAQRWCLELECRHEVWMTDNVVALDAALLRSPARDAAPNLVPLDEQKVAAHFPMERFGECSCGAHIQHPRGGGSWNHGEWETAWAKHFCLTFGSPRPTTDTALTEKGGSDVR